MPTCICVTLTHTHEEWERERDTFYARKATLERRANIFIIFKWTIQHRHWTKSFLLLICPLLLWSISCPFNNNNKNLLKITHIASISARNATSQSSIPKKKKKIRSNLSAVTHKPVWYDFQSNIIKHGRLITDIILVN